MRSLLLTLLLSMGLYAASHSAKVLESIDSGGYSYIKVDEKGKKYWIAMTERPVKKGDVITYDEQGWMTQFHSKTLDRTFEKLLFASDVVTPSVQQKVAAKPDIMSSEFKQSGTITIAALFADRSRYAGKKVRVRGRVTKTSAQIMKRNWVHLQDGSSYRGQDDLVFTTTGKMPAKGSVVTAEGTVVVDKDFGYGYFYPVIVEDTAFLVK